MPFTAKIKREDAFCSADQREIYATCAGSPPKALW
jgi:hypothetical protein